jgi:hypothetical protein
LEETLAALERLLPETLDNLSKYGEEERTGALLAILTTCYPPLLLITSPYIAHCMGACKAKGS